MSSQNKRTASTESLALCSPLGTQGRTCRDGVLVTALECARGQQRGRALVWPGDALALEEQDSRLQ